MLLAFWFWSNIILQTSHDEILLDSENYDKEVIERNTYRHADIIFCIILIICSSFFMVTEVE